MLLVPWRALCAVALATLLMAVTTGGESIAAKSKTSSLKALVAQTRVLPREAASAKSKAKLLVAARRAARLARKSPCAAVRGLASYRRTLSRARVRAKVRGKRTKARLRRRLAALGPASLAASRALLADARTKRCGGGVVPSKLPAAKTTVLKSNTDGMTLRVQLPALQFSAQSGGGKSFTQLTLPNTDAPGASGAPAIPVVSSTYVVPDGAKVSVVPGKTESYTIQGVDVYPRQPDPQDDTKAPDFGQGVFADRPFTLDAQAYKSDALVPAQPAAGQILGQARDVTIGGLQIPAAQYDAADHTLKVLNTVDVQVKFVGGTDSFSPTVFSPWETAQLQGLGLLVNFRTLVTQLNPLYVPQRCGEEMLVITNPSTRLAADQFAALKRGQGMLTVVAEVGTAAGQLGLTAGAIQTFVRGQLTSATCVHPSYVTIMGDDDLVPTFTGPGGIPSDLPYALKDAGDELPDVAAGRIIGNDQAALATAVSKIAGYETTAPTANGMLTKALVAAQFQDDDGDGQENRTFVQFAETVRNGLVKRGVAVDRVYNQSPGNNPLRFNDGTDLPAALKKPAFAWNGTGAQVATGWNAGRFLVVHRDHGWSDGWGLPSFGTADVNALTNGSRLPVLLSINCSSGAYDYDETSFAGSALVAAGGGAVGVFGDTRDSPSWHNSQIALGFVDAMLPSILPGEGPATAERTGAALINGKLRLAALAPGDGNTRNELYLWHYFGDPSMKLWGGGTPPTVFRTDQFNAVYHAPVSPGDAYSVTSPVPAELNGQTLSLIKNGEVIGKAFASGGFVTVQPSFGDGTANPGELELAADGEHAQPIRVPVSGIPAPAGPGGGEPTATTLTQSCPEQVGFTDGPRGDIVVTGHLGGAPPGSTVAVSFKHPDRTNPPSTGPTDLVNATTDANGDWTASEHVDFTEPVYPTDTGNWTVSSKFAATSTLLGSEAGPCTIYVYDNS
jgi:peptidase C25-like protein